VRSPSYPASVGRQVSTHRKDVKELATLTLCQRLRAHATRGEMVWVAKFSPDGQFLATAGGTRSQVHRHGSQLAPSAPRGGRLVARWFGGRLGFAIVRVLSAPDVDVSRAAYRAWCVFGASGTALVPLASPVVRVLHRARGDSPVSRCVTVRAIASWLSGAGAAPASGSPTAVGGGHPAPREPRLHRAGTDTHTSHASNTVDAAAEVFTDAPHASRWVSAECERLR